MRGYVVTDTVRRLFLSAGYAVTSVINITDVGHLVGDGDIGEDKLEKGARREGKSVWDIAKYYTEDYFKCLEILNIPLSAYHFPKATDTIAEQIALIKILEEKGYTYTTSDGIYFDTSKFPSYKDLAKLSIEGLKSGARVEENIEKKNITDFALWKFSPKNEKRQMEWESPWGIGFPGWHIECSAMSKSLLGSHFDIHMGGIDHIPVHHTNEIAQSECANGEKYVNYWLHYNFLNDVSGKMSKSNGEFLRLKTLVDEGISPLAYRYYLLLAHYRSEIQFSFESLRAAETAYKKLYALASEWNDLYKSSPETPHAVLLKSFYSNLYDDVNTPKAIAVLWRMLGFEDISDEKKYVTLLAMDQTLGLNLRQAKKINFTVPEEVQKLLIERAMAREKKNFIKSDELRKSIEKLGFKVIDGEGKQDIELL
jgi:cysteinyl-tRNA synthetase